MISADSRGNGQIAAVILASCVAQGGTIGLVNFGVDYFSTNERTRGVGDWMKKNRPDIQMKQVDFTDPSKVSQIAGDFLTANPDVKGVFAVWDVRRMQARTAARACPCVLARSRACRCCSVVLHLAGRATTFSASTRRPHLARACNDRSAPPTCLKRYPTSKDSVKL